MGATILAAPPNRHARFRPDLPDEFPSKERRCELLGRLVRHALRQVGSPVPLLRRTGQHDQLRVGQPGRSGFGDGEIRHGCLLAVRIGARCPVTTATPLRLKGRRGSRGIRTALRRSLWTTLLPCEAKSSPVCVSRTWDNTITCMSLSLVEESLSSA